MSRFKNQLIVIAVLSVLGITGTIMNTRRAAAQGPPDGLAVKIVNTTVTLPVTGTVNVGNLGATTLPVAVTNFPAAQPVSVNNFPGTQNVSGTVNIGTLPAVQATVVNTPGSFPFVESLTSSSPTFAIPSTIGSVTVKSVAITEVGGFCTGIGNIFNFGLQDISGGNPVATFFFTLGNLLGGVFPIVAQETHIFIAAGHSIGINDNTPPHGCRLDLTGYYITQ